MEYGYCNICKRKLTGYNDYVIKNNDLEKTVQIIMTIIENEYKMCK